MPADSPQGQGADNSRWPAGTEISPGQAKNATWRPPIALHFVARDASPPQGAYKGGLPGNQPAPAIEGRSGQRRPQAWQHPDLAEQAGSWLGKSDHSALTFV